MSVGFPAALKLQEFGSHLVMGFVPWRFVEKCPHSLSGQTVPLPDIPEGQ